MKTIEKYYESFIGIEKDTRIIKTKNRDLPLNEKYFYPIIISKYKNKTYISVSPKYYDKIKELNILDLTKEKQIALLQNIFKDYQIKIMYRMYKKDIINVQTKSRRLNKKLFINSVKNKDRWDYYKDKVSYVYVEDNKIVSMAFVSNIDYCGCNIVVETKKEYRNLGYGKDVVATITNEILKRNLIPIYLVNRENKYSYKLAKSLGYEILSEEIIVST